MHRVSQLGINLVRIANPSLSSLKAGALPLSLVSHLQILVGQRLKHLPAMWETQVRSLDREDPLEKEMETHSTITWRIPWMEEPGML